MKVSIQITCFILHIIGLNAFNIPDELTSLLLHGIYPNIPALKKGTDFRIGWGFRLGDRADFQVMVELGPQTNTQPLANQGGDNNTNKRNTINNLANTLYAERQQGKQNQLEKEKVIPDDTILEEMEKAKRSKPKKQVNKTVLKKATVILNRSLISILTQDDRPTEKPVETIESLEDVSLE